MANLGYREVGIIEQAVKDVLDEIAPYSDIDYFEDATEFRKSLLTTLMQATDGSTYDTHGIIVDNYYQKTKVGFNDLKINTALKYMLTSFKTLQETDSLNTDTLEWMWATRNDEAFILLEDIVDELVAYGDIEVSTASKMSITGENNDIINVLEELVEKTNGSELKLQDFASESLIRSLSNLFTEEMSYFELGRMYATWPSTEGHRPFLTMLTEVYEQIDIDGAISNETVEWMFANFQNNLEIDSRDMGSTLIDMNQKVGPGQPGYNPQTYMRQAVKNMVKYYFEQLGKIQADYVNFEGVENVFLDGGEMWDNHALSQMLQGGLADRLQVDMPKMFFNAKHPAQFIRSLSLGSLYQGRHNIPHQIGNKVIDAYWRIIGKENLSEGWKTNADFAGKTASDFRMTPLEFMEDVGYDIDIDDADLKSKLTNLTIDVAAQEPNALTTPYSVIADKLLNTTAQDVYVVPPYKLKEAVEILDNEYSGVIWNQHKEIIDTLKEVLYQDLNFEPRNGADADLDVVLTDWLETDGTFYSKSPAIENLPEPSLVRGLVAAAGGPSKMKPGYQFPQYFNNRPNDPYIPNPGHYGVDETEMRKVPKDGIKFQYLEDVEPLVILETKGGLHARPSGKLNAIAKEVLEKTGETLYIIKDGVAEPINSPIAFVKYGSMFDTGEVTSNGRIISNIPLYLKNNGNASAVMDVINQYDNKTLVTFDEAGEDFDFGIKKPPYEPTNTGIDNLDDAISKTDGVENLNKSKEIIRKNPGVFRKIFSVLEKLDIGDQVITKAVLPTLGRMGVAGATGPLALAYTGYEIALLLADVASSTYQAKTTDETFWENFGEISDKYSIAYKISKPVYDIILGNLSTVLEQEDEEFIPQYNYGR